MISGVLAFALAAASAAELRLNVNAGSTARVMPVVSAGRVDVAVYGNRVDLRRQVLDLHARDSVRAARAVDTGGDWMLTLWLSRTTDTVELEQVGDVLRVSVGPGDLPMAPAPAAPDIDGVLKGNTKPLSCPVATAPIALLPARDERLLREQSFPHVRVPVWTEAEPAMVGWSEVSGTREIVASTRHGAAAEQYRLGALHRDLGHMREAAWYFRMAAEQSPAKAGIARLQSAAALLAVGRLEDAALAARKAATEGATPESVLHVLGAIAHAGPGADAGAIGRALAATTPDPQALALAATLLVEAGCVDEAVDVYDRALPYLGREQAAIAQFSKADALFYLGRWDDAAVGYTAVDRRQLSDTASALLRSRLRVLTLEAQSPLLWQGSLADLERASKAEGPAGAADLYTLAQVQQVLGDPVHALESFAALSGRFPTLVAGVVGEQHWLALSSRLSTLIAENRALDALALHRAGWADALLPRVTDPQVLSVVAAEYARAGLSASALAAWRVVADVERRGALDSRETVLAITQLYVDQAAYVDAIDAAAWFRKHPLPLERRGEVALLEGRALVGLGKTAEAREKFRLAARSTASSASATARVALLDAATGACEAAIPVLATVAAEPPDDLDRVVLNDALVACMVSTGNEAGAAAPALLSAGDTPDAKTQSMRTYQAMRLSGAATPGILTDAAESAPGVWGQLAREERAHRELTARLK